MKHLRLKIIISEIKIHWMSLTRDEAQSQQIYKQNIRNFLCRRTERKIAKNMNTVSMIDGTIPSLLVWI